MCLTIEWFEKREERRQRRDRYGVSIKDAEAALAMYYSTVDPVATEMGEWILENWPPGKIARLSASSREILSQISQDLESPD